MERPTALTAAAGLVALEAAALAVYGIVELVRAVVDQPQSRGTAVLLGVVVLIYAAGVATTAIGLWRVRRWAQTPTIRRPGGSPITASWCSSSSIRH